MADGAKLPLHLLLLFHQEIVEILPVDQEVFFFLFRFLPDGFPLRFALHPDPPGILPVYPLVLSAE